MKNARFPETVLLTIESLTHEGRGKAILDGKTTFVSGGLANETVSCQITKKHSRYNEADVLEVISRAPERAQPICSHFGVCGGCSLQHMNEEAQLLLKQNSLLEQLHHFGKVSPESILPPLTGQSSGYRRKARLGVRYVKKKERVLVGFREKQSNFLTDVKSCPVLHQSIGSRIEALGALIASLDQFEQIPQIEVAASDIGTALVIRHLTPLPEEDIAKLCEFAKINDLHFYLQPNPPAKIHKIWPKESPELLTYYLSKYQLSMQFHPLDFIQINGEINQLLLERALQLLDPQKTDTVLDLFCGLGNFSLPIARFAKSVIGVEGSQDMVSRARQNATLNDIQNAEFHMENLMEPSSTSSWIKQTYHKILLDPPRTGAKEILGFIPQFSANRIVYVSCNPATLARDAGELVYTYGYKLKQVGVINMFPHTSHIEAIALFEK